MAQYAIYKKPIKTTIEVDGVVSNIVYMPSRILTQLQKYLDEGMVVATGDELKNQDWFELDEYSRMAGVKESCLASSEESDQVIEDMMRVIALLTDEEMLKRVVIAAEKKKDGHMKANRYAVNIFMDGVFPDGSYYRLGAKSDKSDNLEIKIVRETLSQFSYHYGNAHDFLEENKDIVSRMGI